MSSRDDEDELDARPADLRVTWRLLAFVRPHLGLLALGLVGVLAGTALTLAGPKLIGRVVDAIAARDGRAVEVAALALAATSVGLYVARWGQAVALAALGQRVLYDLRLAVHDQVQRQALGFFQRWPVGKLVTRLTGDVESLAELFSVGMLTILGDLATVVGVTVVLLVTAPRLGALGLTALPVTVALVAVLRRPIRAAARVVRRRVAELAAFANERVQGARVVRAFAGEAEDAARFADVNAAVVAAYGRRTHLDAIHGPGVRAITGCAVGLVLWQGGEGVLAREVSPGTLLEVIAYLFALYVPATDMASKYTLVQQAAASAERVLALLDLAPSIADPPDPVALPEPARGEVELRGVRLSYHEAATGGQPRPWALDGVSFLARPGETVAIVGATGAGKSSLAHLVLRLWDPQEGQVLLDGVDVRRVRQRDLRARVALVLQDVVLFSGTIGENIALGAPGAGQAAIERAARAVAAHEVIERLGGYGAVVGERAQTISHGERQLISFARALVRDPAVLILDEATASVDRETEARLQAGVRALCAGRTALVIAHRLATVQAADRIVVLHHGRVAEVGTHRELLARGGLYARLVELQRVAADEVPAA